MAIIKGVKTISSTQKWQSPDGQRTIWSVVMDYQGKQFNVDTFSEKISETGWTGDVESREGKKGETIVRQAPREDGQFAGQGQSFGNRREYTPKPAYQPKDEAAIKAMWAIGQAINAHTSLADDGVASLEAVESYATSLFNMVDRVKTGGKDALDEDANAMKEQLNTVFGDTESFTVENEQQPMFNEQAKKPTKDFPL